ncbi:MAG: hypothetical protein A2021_04475 [Elusimicrobia bacterium GWF2_52_66]|nr:MAG: hypothetical protein A2X33_08440 [Elusimicrobia bacterium GWA2_51_34]OGR86267.1 MAG: hypothetical protein A2021_04475 [Elusimicrobia bacterium GWF2_52_66]HAF95269.1 hypothetical protein [Elusimicrobiota bacterium]HCE97347.1 hypothetical protein [Elusimicrobiota bacterium]
MKTVKLIAILALSLAPLAANATPSTQIWIPSTDIQKYKSLHLNVDNYLAAKREPGGLWKAPVFMAGPTVGILPYEKVQAEVGFDIMKAGLASDNYPFYVHVKVGTPEGTAFAGSPALAIGGYNFGMKQGVTNQNIVYGLAAKNLAKLGRLSAGYYSGNDNVLLDDNGDKANTGVLLSWDRTISEVSDKLWAAVDYQGSDSAMGAFSFGVSWAFASNTSVIFGYDVYNNHKMAGADTFTVQLDINLW